MAKKSKLELTWVGKDERNRLEPLLGPLPDLDLAGIDWVILGGESGPGAAPQESLFFDDTQMHIDAAARLGIRAVRFENPVQCEAVLAEAGVI